MGGFDELIERLLHDVALAGTEGKKRIPNSARVHEFDSRYDPAKFIATSLHITSD